jgi:hypothetical protein
MSILAPVDMWHVRCARCEKPIGCTNGNAGIEVPIYCLRCEPEFIREADEMMVALDAFINAEPRS